MTDAQYMRLERLAGGWKASNIQFIRACYTVLCEVGKSRAMRDVRHQWIRQGLAIKRST